MARVDDVGAALLLCQRRMMGESKAGNGAGAADKKTRPLPGSGSSIGPLEEAFVTSLCLP